VNAIGGLSSVHIWRRGALALVALSLVAVGVRGHGVASAQTPARQVILDERFADNTRGWPTTFTTSNGTAGRNFFNENGYNIAIPDQPVHYAWFIGSNPPPVAADVYAETEVKAVDGPLTAAYGLSIRTKELRGPGYLLLIRGDQRYTLIREGYDDDVTLIPWTRSDALKPGREANTIALAAIGPLLAVHINGKQVARFEDGTISGSGGVFLRVQNTLTVAARRLLVGGALPEDVQDRGGGDLQRLAAPTAVPARPTAVPAAPAQPPAQAVPLGQNCPVQQLMTGSLSLWDVLPGLYGAHPSGQVLTVYSSEDFATAPCWGEGFSPVWLVDVLVPEEDNVYSYAISDKTILTGATLAVKPRGPVTERSIQPLFALAEAPPELLDSVFAWDGVLSVNANDALRRMGAQLKTVELISQSPLGPQWQFLFNVPAANARLLVIVNAQDVNDVYVITG